MKNNHLPYMYVNVIIILIAVVFGYGSSDTPPKISTQEQSIPPGSMFNNHSINILVDDFSPQWYLGNPVDFFNRLEGNRGRLDNSTVDWGKGEVKIKVSAGNSRGGIWMSLNHPRGEHLPINFSSILPQQILPTHQSQITGLTIKIARGTPDALFKIELKNDNTVRWQDHIKLTGHQQTVEFNLTALRNNGHIDHIVLFLDDAKPRDEVVLDNVSFTATTPIMDTAMAAFVWSYGMLLNNWDPDTGLVRDKAKEMSGEFDAIQATGSLAAATAIAKQLNIVDLADAQRIVQKISDALLRKVPRKDGLWPHFVVRSPSGRFTIVGGTEWSSVDTVIAAIGLLTAQSALEMDVSGTEQMLQAINWRNLIKPNGISHGYNGAGVLIPHSWDVFGGESWLMEMAYAGVMKHVAPILHSALPTANGSGFIDELAWLYVPPPRQDYWGTDWTLYRRAAADNQISYYPAHDLTSCFAQLGLFGLSASEVPSPATVNSRETYQAFGVGGRPDPANDGLASLGARVVVPHYSAMIASLRPEKTIKMWEWLINHGFFSPLNNVESLMFPEKSGCDADSVVWNQLKGSWNLALQTLGWGRYLAQRRGESPILWQATIANPLLHTGHSLLSKVP
jgi:hypothetical protein